VAGKLHTPIHATYDVEQIKEAILAAADQRQGKILITPHHA
jgi:mitochondrial enoyl-[acyl-carrier protein] reductase / trans-2-enoyl-CoA reductase